MKRESSNTVRWWMEELLPPALRDSRAFAWLMARAYPLVPELAEFRRRAHALSAQEYAALYGKMPRIHGGTDNSAAVLREVQAHTLPGKVIDVGCGTGYTLDCLARQLPPGSCQFTGVDFQVDADVRRQYPAIRFAEHDILDLPFADASFDTVICTHTLEHILDIRAAIAELRRICAKRLIIVVPREREGLYTFNPHFHFFPYLHSFLRVMIPLPAQYTCRDVGRDIVYVEDR